MPGMRTSMITTFGRRRSASATALAPSEASPITRMCGARDSDSRSPSRTTSWSSTIRVVISGGDDTLPRILFRPGDDFVLATLKRQRLNGQRQLLGLGRRGKPEPSPIADPILPGQPRDLVTDRLHHVGSQVGLLLVELLILGEQLGPVLGKMQEEVLTRPGPKEEQVGPDAGRAGLARRMHDF